MCQFYPIFIIFLPTLSLRPNALIYLLSLFSFFIFLIIFYQLCYYSCPDFSLLALLPLSNPHYLRQSTHHCSCPWVMHISSLDAPFSILQFTSSWKFCNYLFVLLNLLTCSPIPPYPLPIWQPSKRSLYP